MNPTLILASGSTLLWMYHYTAFAIFFYSITLVCTICSLEIYFKVGYCLCLDRNAVGTMCYWEIQWLWEGSRVLTIADSVSRQSGLHLPTLLNLWLYWCKVYWDDSLQLRYTIVSHDVVRYSKVASSLLPRKLYARCLLLPVGRMEGTHK